jgi:hypothetical protein
MRLLLHMEDCEVVRVEATFNEHLKRGLFQPTIPSSRVQEASWRL